ncbi:MAG: hypothetical protein JRG67_12470 [Deltaproteobacteria bacterium]|nr:hypothetical protein [Deltaproteobacteria bacterium]MBW1876386.1 hypothetical protein [Deltaproteobacteria bacterium]MBW2211834.1 hypothetical protein [Deltaproteobacteria bacterium]MBW2215008.1 hypothetical protein [Deltaproteobacteria bacterium]MBW2381149.1 hypothetical protein [Deltaproteobacteria bacterium]
MFTLDDQFGRTHRQADVFGDGPVVILAGAQRQAPDAMRAWEQALRARVPEGTRIVGLSNLERLPFFVPKGVVTKGLAQQLPNVPVLCDWKGRVHADLGFPAGATISVGVFSVSGERLGIITGEQTEPRLAEIVQLLSR